MERTRRLFTTLNRYAKPVSKSEIVALDEDDIIAITTRELVENHQLFQEKISLSKTKAVSVNDNRSFTTIITLYDVLDILFKTKEDGQILRDIVQVKTQLKNIIRRVQDFGTLW